MEKWKRGAIEKLEELEHFNNIPLRALEKLESDAISGLELMPQPTKEIMITGEDVDTFISVMIEAVSKAVGLPVEILTEAFKYNSYRSALPDYIKGIRFMRHYVQAGPWAEMLREG